MITLLPCSSLSKQGKIEENCCVKCSNLLLNSKAETVSGVTCSMRLELHCCSHSDSLFSRFLADLSGLNHVRFHPGGALH